MQFEARQPASDRRLLAASKGRNRHSGCVRSRGGNDCRGTSRARCPREPATTRACRVFRPCSPSKPVAVPRAVVSAEIKRPPLLVRVTGTIARFPAQSQGHSGTSLGLATTSAGISRRRTDWQPPAAGGLRARGVVAPCSDDDRCRGRQRQIVLSSSREQARLTAGAVNRDAYEVLFKGRYYRGQRTEARTTKAME